MELYHLDWNKAAELGGGRITDYIMPAFNDDEAFAQKVQKAFEEGELYSKVATFDGHQLQSIFTLSQNIDSNWTEEPIDGMTIEAEGPRRSTSVGDVIRDGETFYAISAGPLVIFTPSISALKP